MMQRRVARILLALLSAASSAQAADEEPLGRVEQPIWLGEPASTCSFPSVVSLGRECSGTLVHPEVVLYAAHCGTDFSSVEFGEASSEPAKSVPVTACEAFPDSTWGHGNDFAFCRLATLQRVPTVTILDRCGLSKLEVATPVTLVGFGLTDQGLTGIKHVTRSELRHLTPNGEAFVGGTGGDSCVGDSGGPALLELVHGDTAAWRLLGVASYGTSCGEGGYYSPAHRALDWLEERTGLDLSSANAASLAIAIHGDGEGAGRANSAAEPTWTNDCLPPLVESSESPSSADPDVECSGSSSMDLVDHESPEVAVVSTSTEHRAMPQCGLGAIGHSSHQFWGGWVFAFLLFGSITRRTNATRASSSRGCRRPAE